MWSIILSALYLFLPAYGANMMPVIANRINIFPSLAVPIDGGRYFNGKPLLGANKTVRGIVTGVITGMIVALIQYILFMYSFFERITVFPLENVWIALLWGVLMGGGALVGDAGKSFIKRQLNIPPGHRWIPWDQLDMVIGALVFGSFMFPLYEEYQIIITILILTPLLGLSVNLTGYFLAIKDSW